HPFGVSRDPLDVLLGELFAQELHGTDLGQGFSDRGLVHAAVAWTDFSLRERSVTGFAAHPTNRLEYLPALLDHRHIERLGSAGWRRSECDESSRERSHNRRRNV